jgi:hypothetical protein
LTVQKRPSLQAEPSGSFPVHDFPASLQLSAQLLSPSGPGHGVPACTVHAPAAHLSAPLQNVPSSHVVPVCGVHVPGVVPLQVWQSFGLPPPHAVVQQTVSTQVVPVPHIESREHEPPGVLTGWHWFTLQK